MLFFHSAAFSFGGNVQKKNWLNYYSGDCSSNETQKLIKEGFIRVMNSSVCNEPGGCGFDNVVVKCGPVSRWKRESPNSQPEYATFSCGKSFTFS